MGKSGDGDPDILHPHPVEENEVSNCVGKKCS